MSSGVDFSRLADKLYSCQVITNECYGEIIHTQTGQSSIDRLRHLFHNVVKAVRGNGDIMIPLLKSLEECGQSDLAKRLINDYKTGILCTYSATPI